MIKDSMFFFIYGFPVDIYPKLKLNLYSNKKIQEHPWAQLDAVIQDY